MIITRYRKTAALVMIVAVFALAASAVLLPRLLNLDSSRDQIRAMVNASLGLQVSYESASFALHAGPAFTFNNVVIMDTTGETPLLEADHCTFTIAILPLLHKEVQLHNLILERPRLNLTRNAEGRCNVAELFSGKQGDTDFHLGFLRVRNGRISFTDHFKTAAPLTISLDDIQLSLRNPNRGEQAEVELSAQLGDNGSGGSVRIKGSASVPAAGQSLTDTVLDLSVAALNIDAGHYWPFYGRYLPVAGLRGVLELNGKIRGSISACTSSGRLGIKGLRLDYPQVFPATVAPQKVSLSYHVALTPREVQAQSIDLTVDDLRVRGNCTLSDIRSGDMQISAMASISPFRLEEVNGFIPYPIIPAGTADFIKQHISGGRFTIDELRLNGRISQLRQLGQGDNFKALSVRGRVDSGIVTLGRQIPDITGIAGTLELTGKDFFLQGMTGRFGSSPMTLTGAIAGFSLKTPTTFPFSMNMVPSQTEVDWLLHQEKSRKLTLSGRSLLRLAGGGPTDDYRLNGTWDLTSADYRYGELFHKPSGVSSRLGINARLDETAARIEGLRYELPDLRVTANATYRYADQEQQPLSFTVTTDRFAVEPNLAFFPGLSRYHPAGTLQGTLSGRGNPASEKPLALQGAITCTDVSVRPFAAMLPFSRINGTIDVTGTALETSGLTATIGDSPFTVAGHLTGFSSPVAELKFSSPALQMSDLGFHSSGEKLNVRKLAGAMSLGESRLAITSLTGELENTAFSVAGTVTDFNNPLVDLQAAFPRLRAEDLIPFTRLTRDGGPSGTQGIRALTAVVTAETGSAHAIPFERLSVNLTLENEQLIVKTMTVGLFGGTVAGSGQADFAAASGPIYQAQYRLGRLNALSLLKAAGVKGMIAGTLSGEGEMTSNGNTLEDLISHAQGSADLTISDGMLRLPSQPSPSNAGGYPFKSFRSQLSVAGKVLALHSLQLDAFDGEITGRGIANFSAPGVPHYEATVQTNKLNAQPMFKAAGAPPEISGMLSFHGNVKADGKTMKEIASSAQGSAEFTLTDGVMRFPAQASLLHSGEFPFRSFRSRLAIAGGVLDLESLQVDAFNGAMTGKGVADFNLPDGPVYSLSMQMGPIDAVPVFLMAGMPHEISGRLTLQGDLTAKGNSVEGMKKTLSGQAVLHLEKGVIYKYPVISKVFSLLNVSQMLDFRLPDLTSSGMPYDTLNGNFTFRNGIATTSDLKLLSSSINMTMVGTADTVNKSIDTTIAVQPLQTVGKIVRRIPVLGWILTGQDRRMLVIYYSAKGPWGDPQVSTMTSTTLTKDVREIFKRIYNLPETIMSDPGKVMLGN